MDESNDPNDKGFAIVGHYAEGDRELIDSPPYSLRDYCNAIASCENNPSGSTEINWTAHVPDNTSITIVDPYNIVCSGGGLSWFNASDPATYSVPSSLYGWWQIVRAVAEKDSTYEHAGVYLCPYCEGSQTREASSLPDEELSKLFPHDADCIVFLARAMIDAMPHVEAKNERVE